jgi:acetyltransferase-like isoleucine patch superfamily enzyme
MRWILRHAMYAVAWVVATPVSIPVRLLAMLDKRDELFCFGSQFFAIFPGLPGVYLRRAFYDTVLPGGAPNLYTGFGTTFAQRDMKIGRDVYIGSHCNIGLSEIGDDVLIGSHVDVISGPDVHHIDRLDVPIRKQGGVLEKTMIGSGSWLANGSIVMASVGPGTVVGAGAVVVRPCQSLGVYVGNPARLVRLRGNGSASATSDIKAVA